MHTICIKCRVASSILLFRSMRIYRFLFIDFGTQKYHVVLFELVDISIHTIRPVSEGSRDNPRVPTTYYFNNVNA